MKNRIKNTFNALKGNNGATLITVLVTMFFLVTIGSALLYMAYTALLIKATEQRGMQNFYDATSVTEQMKAGFQQLASDSVAQAYETTMQNFTNGTTTFEDEMQEAVLTWQTEAVAPEMPLTIAYKSGIAADGKQEYVYDTRVLLYFLEKAGIAPENVYIQGVTDEAEESLRDIHLSGNILSPTGVLSGLLGNAGTISYTDEKIVFEGISISYTNPTTSMRTSIVTDIAIEYPNYFNDISGDVTLDFSSLPNFAVIAVGDLSTNGTSVDGSLYAGEIVLSGAGNTVISDTVITSSEINVPVGHTLTTATGSDLWADGIVLSNSAQLIAQKDSNIYVQNDLSLLGASSLADIEGEFYGFGNSIQNSDESSSIVVNGIGARLDLSDAQMLMLAGHSFIKDSGDSSNGVLMGESVSVRPNQLAYLVPYQALSTTITSNPFMIATGTSAPNAYANMTAPVINGKSLNDYGATVKQMTYPLVGTGLSAVYYFVAFDTAEKANVYFADYFSANPTAITDYLSTYTTLSTLGSSSQTGGNVIEQNPDGSYSMPVINPVNESSALFMQDAYANLCKTLLNTSSSVSNPYEYIIDMAATRKFMLENSRTSNVWEFKDGANNTVGLLVNNESSGAITLTAGSEYSDTDIIVATGDVVVNTAYTGIIIAQGDVTVSGLGSLNAQADDVRAAMQATVGTTQMSVLFTNEGESAISDDSNTIQKDSVTDYVTYENWTKD